MPPMHTVPVTYGTQAGRGLQAILWPCATDAGLAPGLQSCPPMPTKTLECR
jgi:hypothetical protein